MRFMMMIKSDEQTEAGVLPDEKVFAEMTKYNQDLLDAGALLAAEGLHPSSRGARVKFHGGKPTVIDGPFTEAKELIAGYWLIQAPSKGAAIEWAKRAPLGTEEDSSSDQVVQVEVRQLFELEDFPVNEDESGWREQEAAQRAESQSASPARPGYKQFIVFRKADKDTEAGMMPTEELLAAMGAYNEELIRAGVMLTGEGLQPSSKGFRIEYARGKRTVTDGPFAEAKELVAGFSVIQARSKDEAIEWVKRWPALDANGEVELEIRQVFTADDFGDALPPETREAEEQQRARLAGKQ